MIGEEPDIHLSICVPTYQRAELLKSMLAQLRDGIHRHPRKEQIEICISDNGSTDETPRVIAEFINGTGPIQVRHERQAANLGFSGNFAAVVKMARGTAFIVVADDDALESIAIELLFSAVARLSPAMPLVVWNSLPGGDAVARGLTLPKHEKTLSGPDDVLRLLGIFHTSFITNLLFHRETALQAWQPVMLQTRYPHTALAAVLLSNRPAMFVPAALTKVTLPVDSREQPLLTAIDMARLQTTFVLSDARCQKMAGRVYRFLVRMLPTAIYLHRLGECRGNPSNPFADLRLMNAQSCYGRSLQWQAIAAFLWLIASIMPIHWLGALLRRWSRHPR